MTGYGYGVSRGIGYSSTQNAYDPMRGAKRNTDSYSALHYRSNRFDAYSHPNQLNPATNHNHQYPSDHLNSYRANPSTVGSSLHTASNGHYNPYLPTNPTHRVPDLSRPRSPPRDLRTPVRNGTRSRITDSEDEDNKENNTNANGWNFGNAFTKIIGSVGSTLWNTVKGTPLKPKTKSKRQSQSQPPRSPPTNPRSIPQNPYLPESNISSTVIPEDRPTTAPSRVNTTSIASNGSVHSAHDIPLPSTPPQQTRPSISSFLSEQRQGISHDDGHSVNTAGTDKTDGKAVIAIHSLLQKTKLSPDDAAWLHSKIDQVTHDRHDGSLSYIGNVRGAARDAVRQSLDFDDSATEHSYRTVRNQHPVSPLRVNRSSLSSMTTHSAIAPRSNRTDRSQLPSSSMPSSRYTPQPPSFHLPSGSSRNGTDRNSTHSHHRNKYPLSLSSVHGHTDNVCTKMNNSSAIISLGNGSRNRRKRGRTEVFNEEEEDHLEQVQQRKKIKLQRPNSVRKRNYLRPMHSYQPTARYQARRPSTPQGTQSQSTMTRKTLLTKSNTVSMHTIDANGSPKERNHLASNLGEDEEHKEQTQTNGLHQVNGSVLKMETQQKPKTKEVAVSKEESTPNGFAFVSQDETVSVVQVEEAPVVVGDKGISFGTPNGYTQGGDAMSGEISENVLSENNAENKPLKRRKRESRSPLKDGKNGLNSHRAPPTGGNIVENEDDKLKKDEDEATMKALQQEIDGRTAGNESNNEANNMQTKVEEERPKTPTQAPLETVGQNESNNGTNSGVKDRESATGEKKEEETKKKPVGSYLYQVMLERKERYHQMYRTRIKRVYRNHNPSKLKDEWIDNKVKEYGRAGAEKIHSLYVKVCGKYKIKPHQLYDGQMEQDEDEGDEAPADTTTDTKDGDTTDKKEEAVSIKFTSSATEPPSNSFAWAPNTNGDKKEDNTTINGSVFTMGNVGDEKKEEKATIPSTTFGSNGGFSATFKTDGASKTEEKKTPFGSAVGGVSFGISSDSDKKSMITTTATTDAGSASTWTTSFAPVHEPKKKGDDNKTEKNNTATTNGGWNFTNGTFGGNDNNDNDKQKKPESEMTSAPFTWSGGAAAATSTDPPKETSKPKNDWSFGANSEKKTSPWSTGSKQSESQNGTASGSTKSNGVQGGWTMDNANSTSDSGFKWGDNMNGSKSEEKKEGVGNGTAFQWGSASAADEKKDEPKTNPNPFGTSISSVTNKPDLGKSNTAPTTGTQAFQFSLPSGHDAPSNGASNGNSSGFAVPSSGFSFGGTGNMKTDKPPLNASKTAPGSSAWISNTSASDTTNGNGFSWGNNGSSGQDKQSETKAKEQQSGGFDWKGVHQSANFNGPNGTNYSWGQQPNNDSKNDQNASQFGLTPNKSTFGSSSNNGSNSMFGSNGNSSGTNNSFGGFGNGNSGGNSNSFQFNTPMKGMNSNNESNASGGWGSAVKTSSGGQSSGSSNSFSFNPNQSGSANGGNPSGSGITSQSFFGNKPKRKIFKAKRRRSGR